MGNSMDLDVIRRVSNSCQVVASFRSSSGGHSHANVNQQHQAMAHLRSTGAADDNILKCRYNC